MVPQTLASNKCNTNERGAAVAVIHNSWAHQGLLQSSRRRLAGPALSLYQRRPPSKLAILDVLASRNFCMREQQHQWQLAKHDRSFNAPAAPFLWSPMRTG